MLRVGSANTDMFLLGTSKMIELGEKVYILDATNLPNWERDQLIFVWPESEGPDCSWSISVQKHEVEYL